MEDGALREAEDDLTQPSEHVISSMTHLLTTGTSLIMEIYSDENTFKFKETCVFLDCHESNYFTLKQIMSADDHFTLIRLCKLQLIRARPTMSLTNILNLAFIETDTRLPR